MLRPLRQQSTRITESTLGLYVLQIWSRVGHVLLRIEGSDTRVLHRVVRISGEGVWELLSGLCEGVQRQ